MKNNVWQAEEMCGRYGASRRSIFLRKAGFSYAELLLAVFLLAVCLSPVIDSLIAAIRSLPEEEKYIIDQMALRVKMEETLSQPFADLKAAVEGLATPASVSDQQAFKTIDGREIIRNVFLAFHDGNGVTNTEQDLIFVRVEIENTFFRYETLKGKR